MANVSYKCPLRNITLLWLIFAKLNVPISGLEENVTKPRGQWLCLSCSIDTSEVFQVSRCREEDKEMG